MKITHLKFHSNLPGANELIVSIAGADALVLKHQAIITHNTDPVSATPYQFHKKC